MIPRISQTRTLVHGLGNLPCSARHARCPLPQTVVRRRYATEASTIPKSILLRQQPPSAPTSQAQHSESASSISRTVGSSSADSDVRRPIPPEQDIDTLLHSFHEHLMLQREEEADSPCPTVPQLYEQLANKSRTVLDEELQYEDTPAAEGRAIDTSDPSEAGSWLKACRAASAMTLPEFSGFQAAVSAQDDGLVLVAHIIASSPPISSWSLGFMIRTSQGNQYVVSCSHTLESAAHSYRSQKASTPPSSSTLIVTRSGRLLPVTAIVSSLPLHDLVIYSFPESSSGSGQNLKTVPVALYPPQIGSEQSLLMVGEDRWKKGKVIGYKDSRGNDAEVGALPGTYDELTSVSIDVLPTPGSSGGPLVSSSGAVTGLVRGSRMAFGDRRSAGFATPAEKIFEMFQLPGLARKKNA